MHTHLRPEADKFIAQAKRLREKSAPEAKIIGAAEALYSDPLKHKSKRSRLLRACRASDMSFARAVKVYNDGGNIGAIVAALETSSTAGAPKGNLNSRGKKRDFSLTRFTGMWRAMTPAEQNEFLRLNGLSRKQ